MLTKNKGKNYSFACCYCGCTANYDINNKIFKINNRHQKVHHSIIIDLNTSEEIDELEKALSYFNENNGNNYQVNEL